MHYSKISKKGKNIIISTLLIISIIYFIFIKDDSKNLLNSEPPKFDISNTNNNDKDTKAATSAVISHGKAIKNNLDLIKDKDNDKEDKFISSTIGGTKKEEVFEINKQEKEVVNNKVKSNLEESGLLEDHSGELIKNKNKNKENNNNNEFDDYNDDDQFMPKLVNETIKAELGRATWKLFHTILSRYPEEPNETQKNHILKFLDSFVHVYPCGDCARHFQKLLEKYPPQLYDRKTAALWGCHVHNKVNERLNKPIYDCSYILEDYDCGCGEDDETLLEESSSSSSNKKKLDKAELEETNDHLKSIKIESKEDLIHG